MEKKKNRKENIEIVSFFFCWFTCMLPWKPRENTNVLQSNTHVLIWYVVFTLGMRACFPNLIILCEQPNGYRYLSADVKGIAFSITYIYDHSVLYFFWSLGVFFLLLYCRQFCHCFGYNTVFGNPIFSLSNRLLIR